jgi:hypothetical protein
MLDALMTETLAKRPLSRPSCEEVQRRLDDILPMFTDGNVTFEQQLATPLTVNGNTCNGNALNNSVVDPANSTHLGRFK